jgi:hypothetical protein
VAPVVGTSACFDIMEAVLHETPGGFHLPGVKPKLSVSPEKIGELPSRLAINREPAIGVRQPPIVRAS